MATFMFLIQAKYLLVCFQGWTSPLPFLLPLFLIATLTGLSTLLFVLEYLKTGWVSDHLHSSKKPS